MAYDRPEERFSPAARLEDSNPKKGDFLEEEEEEEEVHPVEGYLQLGLAPGFLGCCSGT